MSLTKQLLEEPEEERSPVSYSLLDVMMSDLDEMFKAEDADYHTLFKIKSFLLCYISKDHR
jgi:hypothetical protein